MRREGEREREKPNHRQNKGEESLSVLSHQPASRQQAAAATAEVDRQRLCLPCGGGWV